MENTENLNSAEPEEIGIPEKNRVKRRYTMSPEALKQRKAAAKQPKGPGVARNAWKTGEYAQGFVQHKIKPCLSTCVHFPCELVEDNHTSPGGDCLDKKEVLQTYGVILKGMKGDLAGFNDLAGMVMAETVQVLRGLLEDVLRDGGLVKEEIVDKDGDVKGYRFKQHPALNAIPKILGELSLTPKDFMLTPKAIAQKTTEDEGVKTLASLMGQVGKTLNEKSK